MLQEKLHELISACFTGIWIESSEQHEAIAEIQQLCRDEQWQLATWDIDRGLIIAGGENALDANDPLAAIRALSVMASNEKHVDSGNEQPSQVCEFNRSLTGAAAPAFGWKAESHDRHRFVANRSYSCGGWKSYSLSSNMTCPIENNLRRFYGRLPTLDGEVPADEELEKVLDAAVGLTRLEAENAL